MFGFSLFLWKQCVFNVFLEDLFCRKCGEWPDPTFWKRISRKQRISAPNRLICRGSGGLARGPVVSGHFRQPVARSIYAVKNSFFEHWCSETQEAFCHRGAVSRPKTKETLCFSMFSESKASSAQPTQPSQPSPATQSPEPEIMRS